MSTTADRLSTSSFEPDLLSSSVLHLTNLICDKVIPDQTGQHSPLAVFHISSEVSVFKHRTTSAALESVGPAGSDRAAIFDLKFATSFVPHTSFSTKYV